MKWLFFILLLANLGMFILIYPQQAEKSDDKGLPDLGELLLSKEMAEPDEDAGVEGTSVTAETSVSQAEDAAESQSQTREPQVAEQRQETDSGPQLTGESEKTSQVEEPTTTESDAAAAIEVPVCRTVGYLQNRSDAEIVSVRLRALGLKPELQSETSNEQAGIWVLVPPQASRGAAIEIANRLERDGISDLWRFTSGDLVHAISLGLFRNEERAEARRKEISELGYEVMIKPRYRQVTKYWLYFQQTTASVPTEEGWGELLKNFPDIEVKETSCR
ncbi:MAG: hypothetical protein ABW098_14820 [Candidatus Thiodiazotropha sp.]